MQSVALQSGETRQIEGHPLAKMAQVLGAAEPDLAALGEILAHYETEPADADAAHKFSTTSGQPARFLVVVTPCGLEECFRELARAIGDGPVDPAVAAGLIAKYDFEPV